MQKSNQYLNDAGIIVGRQLYQYPGQIIIADLLNCTPDCKMGHAYKSLAKIHSCNTNDSLCGTTRWKAAKAASKTMNNLDECGIEVAGCRHGFG